MIRKENSFFEGPIYIKEEDITRIAGNAVYHMLVEKINEMFGVDFGEIVKQKTLKAINEKDYKYNVFYDGRYGKEGLGYTYMNHAIKENKQLIADKVKEAVENFDYNKAVVEEVKNLLEEVSDKFGCAMRALSDLIAVKTEKE